MSLAPYIGNMEEGFSGVSSRRFFPSGARHNIL
jgi:hypothetical protein